MIADLIGPFTVAGKTYKWNILVEDNAASAAGAVSTTNSFMQKGAHFMWQFGTAGVAAALPIVDASGDMLFFAGSSDIPSIGPSHPNVFRGHGTPYESVPAGMQWISKNYPNAKTAEVVTFNDSVSQAYGDAYTRAANYFGIKVVTSLAIDRATTDYMPVATKVMQTNPDMVLTQTTTDVLLTKSLRELGYKGLMVCNQQQGNELSAVGAAALEGNFIAFDADGTTDFTPKALRDFAAAYKAKFNEAWLNPPFYCPLYVLTSALKLAGTVSDVKKIAQVMESQPLDSPLGPLSFGGKSIYGQSHQLVLPTWVGTYKSGVYANLAMIDAATALDLQNKVYAAK